MPKKTRIGRIDPSSGLLIPKTLLDEANLPEEGELRVQPGRLIVRAARHSRSGWATAAKRMRARGDDPLLDGQTSTTFDRIDWASASCDVSTRSTRSGDTSMQWPIIDISVTVIVDAGWPVIPDRFGVRFCETNTSYRPDVKLNGSYPLPFDVVISGTYQGLAGPVVVATWNAPGALITPALGRSLAAGALTTKPIQLIEPGTNFLPMRHVFDLRFSKLVRFDRYRLQVMADFYNAFNDNAVSAINATFGNRWLLPTGVTAPRQFQLSAQFDF